MENLRMLLSQISHYVSKDKQIKLEKYKRGENFNVFNVLGLGTNETRTHSAFIAELLNPKGSHGCGTAFLSEFIQRFTTFSHSAAEIEKANIKVELFIGNKNKDATEGGRIDIVISIGKRLILIENKIYAQDQENQLLRYTKYAQDQVQLGSYNEYKLLYLTLYGTEASAYSTNGELQSNKDYGLISYSNDILKWLAFCKEKAVERPLVRETITQYINLIKELTCQDMESTQQKNIFAEMARYPEATAAIFHTGFTAFRNYVFEHFCSPQFEQEATRLGLIYQPSNILSGEKECGFYFYKPEWKHSKICIETESYDHDFYYGISFADTTPNEYRQHSNTVQQILPKKSTDWWPYGWDNMRKYANWKQSSIITAFTSGAYNHYVMDIVEHILNELEQRGIKLI